MLNFKKDHGQPFELVLVNRDGEGKPTGGIQNFIGGSGYELSQQYLRHVGKPKNKKRANKKSGKGSSGDKMDPSVKLVKKADGLTAYIDTSERQIENNEVENNQVESEGEGQNNG